MKIFLIICKAKEHSEKEVYVQTYIEEAKKCGHEIRTVNVYDLNVDYLRAKGDEYDVSLTDELKEAQDNVVWADQLVFVYPIWCLSVPPILLTFICKVFSEGVAVEMSERGPKPLMKDKTAVIMHSCSMPYFYLKYFCSDILMKWWKIVLTKWFGLKIIKRFDFDLIDSVSEKRKQKWIKEVKKFVEKL